MTRDYQAPGFRFLRWVFFGVGVLGCTRRPLDDGAPHGVRDAVLDRTLDQPGVEGINLLLVVDDSISMEDKQQLLTRSLDGLSLVALSCVPPEGNGGLTLIVPSTDGTCPLDWSAHSVLPAVTSAAIISTSLAAAGACLEEDDRAHPVVPSNSNQNPFQYVEQVGAVGSLGCGYEAPLEAMYRFLVDPRPSEETRVSETDEGPRLTFEGVDEELLELRRRFLSPYSNVLVVILTDEDDCSLGRDEDAAVLSRTEPLHHGTSACETDPQSICCRSCGTIEDVPPEGCPSIPEDPLCSVSPTWSEAEDPLHLRCVDQKRRFGRDYLFPIQRYVDALTDPVLVGDDGVEFENPLFAAGRSPDMVSVLTLSGVPWQLIASDDSAEEPLRLLRPADYEQRGTWAAILGDPSAFEPPGDPHMMQSVNPRPGLPIAGQAWDPIHGHEVTWGQEVDLQFSCVFDLAEPRQCPSGSYCPCAGDVESPLCRDDQGNYDLIQRRAQAYPAPRILQFSKAMGDRGLVGSICPRSVEPDGAIDFDFGYAAGFAMLAEASYGSQFYNFSCFDRSLPIEGNGIPECHLIEVYLDDVDCPSMGRIPAPSRFTAPLEKGLSRAVRENGITNITYCEVPPFDGDANAEGTDYYTCANELHPDLSGPGYCYIDPSLGLGAGELVSGCVASHARRLRVLPQVYPFERASRVLMCDYGS